MNHSRLNADRANSIVNKATKGFEQKDLDKLEEIFVKIRGLANIGQTQLRLDEKLERDVFDELDKELDFNVQEYEDFGTEGDYVTFIFWRDADVVEFSDFNFGGQGVTGTHIF